MRRFLLILLVYILPMQSFALGVSVHQAGASCHDEIDCCELPASCQAACNVASALLPTINLPAFASNTPHKPAGFSSRFMSATPAQPIKPPIL